MQPSEKLAAAIVRGSQHTGWPDFLLDRLSGFPAVLEVKLGDKQNLSAAQKRVRNILVEHGFDYFLMRTYPDQTFGIFKWVPYIRAGLPEERLSWQPVSLEEASAGQLRETEKRFVELDRHGAHFKGSPRCRCGWVGGLTSSHGIQLTNGEYREYCPKCGRPIEAELGRSLRATGSDDNEERPSATTMSEAGGPT